MKKTSPRINPLLGIRLAPELLADLQKDAAKRRTTAPELVRELIRAHLGQPTIPSRA